MPRARRLDSLTEREQAVLALVRRGLTNEEIASSLGITVAGAKYHVSQILDKLGVASREEAAAWQPREPRRWWREIVALSLAAKLAGATVVLTAAIGVGALAWGVAVTSSNGGSDVFADVNSEDLVRQGILVSDYNPHSTPTISLEQAESPLERQEGIVVQGGQLVQLSLRLVSSDGSPLATLAPALAWALRLDTSGASHLSLSSGSFGWPDHSIRLVIEFIDAHTGSELIRYAPSNSPTATPPASGGPSLDFFDGTDPLLQSLGLTFTPPDASYEPAASEQDAQTTAAALYGGSVVEGMTLASVSSATEVPWNNRIVWIAALDPARVTEPMADPSLHPSVAFVFIDATTGEFVYGFMQ